MTAPVGTPADPAAGGAPTGTPPAPTPAPTPTPFDPATLSEDAKAWLESERRRIAADESAKARTTSKANAAAEAERELMAKLGYKPDTKPDDAAAELAAERAQRTRLQINYGVRDAAREAGGDHELVAAYLVAKGRLDGLDPSAADFEDRVKGLVATALADKPSMKLVTTPVSPPPGGSGPGTNPAAGATPPGGGGKRSANYVAALQAHYAPKSQ